MSRFHVFRRTGRPSLRRGACGVCGAFFLLSALAPVRAGASLLLPALGFEDDVDLVTPVGGEFMLVPEESEDGLQARLTIVDLDAATGAPLDLAHSTVVAAQGFEDGVDPLVLSFGASHLVFVPTEKENGDEARVLVLQVDNDGDVLEERDILLGRLGFTPDVDGVASSYPRAVVFFLLESEDHTQRGILAIDADPSDGDWGACSLLSNVAAAACAESNVVSWLAPLGAGVDPVAYETCCSVRLAVPVVFTSGGADLLLVDFESDFIASDEPPHWQGTSISVKGVNAGTAHPTPFPGFEVDVDLALWNAGTCGVGAGGVLVPVEGPGDRGDLYLLDGNGVAVWVYSIDGLGGATTIPGYEKGVDIVPLCGLGINELVVSVERADGSDADLLVIEAATGHLDYHLEDAAINPGLVVPGYEIGVEPLVWQTSVVAPFEDASGNGTLLCFDPATGIVQTGIVFAGPLGAGWGFARSVDPVAVPIVSGVTRLYVPVANETTGDANVLFSRTPPVLEPVTVEMLNGIDRRGFAWDVDPGAVNKNSPGQAMIAIPEETQAGDAAQLRFEEVPSQGPYLVSAVGSNSAPHVDFLRALDAHLVKDVSDVLGLEIGLDMASGSGSLEKADPPGSAVPGNFHTDTDTDPTLGWLGSVVSSGDPGANRAPLLAHATPYPAGSPILFTGEGDARVGAKIFDSAGRRVRTLWSGRLASGSHGFSWDGCNDRGGALPNGSYFLRVDDGRGESTRLLLVR